MIYSEIRKLQMLHRRVFEAPWWQSSKFSNVVITLSVLSVLFASFLNWYVRHWQYGIWEQNTAIFHFDDGIPSFTTADAPYFLSVAKSIKEGEKPSSFERKRLYPNNPPWFKRYEANPPSRPLLSSLVAYFSDTSSIKDLLRTANKLILVTAVLSSLMIVFAFGSMGFWVEGAIAASGGGLSSAYLARSGAGRIDTDQLNMGFFYLMLGLVVTCATAKRDVLGYLFSAFCGLTYFVFDMWYPKPYFGWAFFIGLLWLTLVSTNNFKRTIIQCILFLVFSGLWRQGLGISLENAYLSSEFNFSGFIFPNVLNTVTEIRQIEFSSILERTTGSLAIGCLSVFGLILWTFRHPALAIVFGPAIMFMFLNFVIGSRAIFYSAPMLWFGFGWLLFSMSKLLIYKFGMQRNTEIILLATTIISFVVVWFSSPTKFLQAPTFDKETAELFRALPEIVDDKEFIVTTWWDYGYMSMLLNGQPTLHDGGIQTTPATFFIAESLLMNSQKNASKRLKDLASYGYSGVIEGMLGKNIGLPKQPEKNSYLVLTRDMANWMPSISSIASWDIVKGEKRAFSGMSNGYNLNYQKLKCTQTSQPARPICDGQAFDLNSGKIGRDRFLEALIVVRNGRIETANVYENANIPFVLHSDIGDKGGLNFLLHKDLYFSVFHQLFYLGRPEEAHFELVYDNFPLARVFKIK